METQQDFRDLFALLNSHKVEFLVVGGYALAFHGVPRFTGDIDILVNPNPTNAQRILDAPIATCQTTQLALKSCAVLNLHISLSVNAVP